MDPLEIMPAQNADFGDSSKYNCFPNCTTVNPFPSQQLIAITVLFFDLLITCTILWKQSKAGTWKEILPITLSCKSWFGAAGPGLLPFWLRVEWLPWQLLSDFVRPADARQAEKRGTQMAWAGSQSLLGRLPLSVLCPRPIAILCACESFPCSGFAPRPLRGCRQDRS